MKDILFNGSESIFQYKKKEYEEGMNGAEKKVNEYFEFAK